MVSHIAFSSGKEVHAHIWGSFYFLLPSLKQWAISFALNSRFGCRKAEVDGNHKAHLHNACFYCRMGESHRFQYSMTDSLIIFPIYFTSSFSVGSLHAASSQKGREHWPSFFRAVSWLLRILYVTDDRERKQLISWDSSTCGVERLLLQSYAEGVKPTLYL